MQWRRNGIAIPGATHAHLAVSAVQLAHAGIFSALLDGRLLTQPAVLDVVGEASAQNVVAGATATLNVPNAGPGLRFQWQENGAALPSDPRIAGGTSSRLTIQKFAAGDEADYTCLVSTAQDQLVLGPYHLHLLGIPAVTASAPPPAKVSGTFSWQIASTESGILTVTGLPPGLNFSAATGLVTGQPLASGTFQVTIGTKNAAGTGTSQVVTLSVDPFPAVAGRGLLGSARPRDRRRRARRAL